jgi:hypothetical protein
VANRENAFVPFVGLNSIAVILSGKKQFACESLLVVEGSRFTLKSSIIERCSYTSSWANASTGVIALSGTRGPSTPETDSQANQLPPLRMTLFEELEFEISTSDGQLCLFILLHLNNPHPLPPAGLHVNYLST